jgi:hypothetical protein
VTRWGLEAGVEVRFRVEGAIINTRAQMNDWSERGALRLEMAKERLRAA